MADDWLSQQQSTSVAQLVNTQNTQYAIERASSGLTDAALASFLTNAPIPRCMTGNIVGTYASATNTQCVFSATGQLDPYGMINAIGPATGIKFPIDGFYAISFNLNTVAGANGALNIQFVNQAATNITLNSIPFNPTAAATYQGSLYDVLPFRAGNTVVVNIGNSTTGTLTSSTAHLSCVWTAPYNNYLGGQ